MTTNFHELLDFLTDVGAVNPGAADKVRAAFKAALTAAVENASGFTQADIDRAYLNGARDALENVSQTTGKDVRWLTETLDGTAPVKIGVKLERTR